MDKLKDLNELKNALENLKEEFFWLCQKEYEVESIINFACYSVEELIEEEKDNPDENYYTKSDYDWDHADDDWNDR